MDFNQFDRGVFLVNVLGIVYNTKTGKILIGKRERDPFVKNISWSFPGGRPSYKKSLEDSLKEEIQKKTGLDVKIKQLVFARKPKEKKEFLLIYYLCEKSGGKEKVGEKFSEIKWIKPSEIRKYFTTSIDSRLLKILKALGQETL